MDISVQESHDEASQVSEDGRSVCVCVWMLWVLLQEGFAAPHTLFIHRLKVFITPLQVKTNRSH